MRSLAPGLLWICVALAALAPVARAQERTALMEQPGPADTQHPVAAKARAALEANCARCHQGVPPGAAAPPGLFGNVLDLAELARNPALVRPGNPDASPLYLRFLQRHLPQEVFATPAEAPSAKDLDALRDWIKELPASARVCKPAAGATAEEIADAVSGWLAQVGAAVARDTRFFSLAAVANDCAGEAELASHRQGLQKLIASLSWSELPPRIETVGDSMALFAFRLSDMGWVGAHWERLAKQEPAALAMRLTPEIAKSAGTERPVLRADWFASVASRPPLYYDLLGLPPRLPEVARLVGVDTAQAANAGKSKRAALRASTASRLPRVFERLQGERGALWLAYDLPGDGADPFERPFGPQSGAGGSAPFRHTGTRAIFSLPNGFLGFASFDADGRRIDRFPAGGRDYPETQGHAGGQACMSCHGGGVRPFTDEMRPYAQADKNGWLREVREAVLAAYPPQAELSQLIDNDAYRFRRALVQAGVDPDLRWSGVEFVTALARRYEQPLDLARVAVELGLEPAVLAARLDGVSSEDMRPLAMRLAHGALDRAEALRLMAGLAATAADGGRGDAIATGSVAQEADQAQVPFTVALWADRARYKAGDLATIKVRASADCYLTLVGIDKAGKATVLFPNDFEMENLISAGRVLSVPGPNAAYQLRLKETGQETIAAICRTATKIPPGIEHDFERQRFTLLGNWRSFLATTYASAGEDRQAGDRGGRRRGQVQSKVEPKKPDIEARTAIKLTVE